jgi:solute carrier family 44 protein 1 (choline transporter-like protein)
VAPELPVRLRRVRDSGALLFMLAFLGFLGYVIWDGIYLKGADIDLIVHGHDSFGNICGRNNKPIRLSEKSGRNYSDRPYTKYTLVNSKFERYTGRVRYGELVYVKEQLADLYDDREASRAETALRLKRIKHDAQKTVAISSMQAKRVDLIDFTKEKIFKPKQVERVTSSPPYSTTLDAAASAPFRAGGATLAATSKRDEPKEGSQFKTISDKSKSSYGSSVQLWRSLATNGTAKDNIAARPQNPNNKSEDDDKQQRQQRNRQRRSAPIQTAGPPVHFDPVELARTNRSLLNALRSNMMYQYPPMYGYSSPATAMRNDHSNRTHYDLNKNERSGSATLASPADTTSQRSIVLFADRTSSSTSSAADQARLNNSINESDRYEHMLVNPKSVTTNGGQLGGSYDVVQSTGLITQNDVPNQLLYLTECVSSCPSDHVELIFYRCMPNNWRFSLFPNAINVTRTFIDDIVTDVSHCYRELVYTFSFSLVLSLLLLILLRFLASLIVWSCIILLTLMFIAMASYSWLTFYQQIMDLEQVLPHDSVYAEKLASSDKWLIGSIFLTFLAFAIIGTVLFMRKRILLVTTLFKESGKAIADMPLLLLQPLLTFAVLVSIMGVWIMGFICLQAMKVPVVDKNTSFVIYRTETLYKIMKWYHIFSFLWVSHFAIACQHYVIGASVSKWYFSPNRYQLGSPIGTSISELILYYMGTVALGSFLVAIFKVIRVITRQIQFLVQRSCMSPPLNSNQAVGNGYMNPSASTSSNSTCGSLGYIWRLFIWFFDNIVMIINRDAYVEVAIHGHSFLAGARRAFFVLASNPLRLLAIKSVGNLLLVLAKFCVVIGTVSMAYLLLEGKNQQLNYSWSPIVLSAVFAYIVAHWFLSVYEMVIDALFICYCEDFEQKNIELNQAINGSNFRAQILNNGQIY